MHVYYAVAMVEVGRPLQETSYGMRPSSSWNEQERRGILMDGSLAEQGQVMMLSALYSFDSPVPRHATV